MSAVLLLAAAAASLCNGMEVTLVQVNVDGVELGRELTPGACVPIPNLKEGSYTLHFIEQSGQQSALCQRGIALKPGASIAIAPDDGSQCLF